MSNRRVRVSARVQRALDLYGDVHMRRREDDTTPQKTELERLLREMSPAESDAYYQGVAIRRRVTT